MSRMFVASIILRDTVKDVYGEGAIPKSHRSRCAREDDITAPTLVDLINKLKDDYKLENGNITVQPDSTDTIILTRHETLLGSTPTPDYVSKWKRGETIMLLVDYTIKIRIEETVDFTKMSDAELAAAGISG